MSPEQFERRLRLINECAEKRQLLAIAKTCDELLTAYRQKCSIIEAVQLELSESIDLATSELGSERLAGNVVKEEFWKGELAALGRIRAAIQAALEKMKGETK